MPKTDSLFSPSPSAKGGEDRDAALMRPTAIYSHIGARSEQQDCGHIWKNSRTGAILIVVCDGVGGSRSGGEASAIVVQTAEQLWRDRGESLPDPQRDLLSLSRVAHERITDLAQDGEKRAPASTIAALYLTPTEAHWIHSGDSRLYRFQHSQMISRTRDHSVVQILVNQGEVREKDMGRHPDQGRLLQSLGVQEYRPPTYATAPIDEADAFLLCTDGFWERTSPALMAALLRTDPQYLEQYLRKAVHRAVRANGPKSDNVTAAVVAPLRLPASLVRYSQRPYWLIAISIVVLAALGSMWWGLKRSNLKARGAENTSSPVVSVTPHPSHTPKDEPSAEPPVPPVTPVPSVADRNPQTQSTPPPVAAKPPEGRTGSATELTPQLLNGSVDHYFDSTNAVNYWRITVKPGKFVYLAEHEVTEGEWRAVFPNSPQSSNLQNPARNVSGQDAAKFAATLTENWARSANPLLRHLRYRLPTVEEWCAAAATALFLPNGLNKNDLLHPVDGSPSHGKYVFDLFGNVSEIVQESGDFFAIGPNFNEPLPERFLTKLSAGDTLKRLVGYIKDSKKRLDPGGGAETVGLRLVLVQDEPSPPSGPAVTAPEAVNAPPETTTDGKPPHPVPVGSPEPNAHTPNPTSSPIPVPAPIPIPILTPGPTRIPAPTPATSVIEDRDGVER